MFVKDKLLVIRMGVAGLTQRGSSWGRERVPVKITGIQKPYLREGSVVPVVFTGMQKPQKNCGNLWKELNVAHARSGFHKYFEMGTMYADVIRRP